MADAPRSIVLDAPVLGSAVNEWPYGRPAALLRGCIAQETSVLVFSDRLKTEFHGYRDSGYVHADEETFRGFVGLVEGQALFHVDDLMEAAMPWPDYVNSLAASHLASAVITFDPDVKNRITAAPVFDPDSAPDWLFP